MNHFWNPYFTLSDKVRWLLGAGAVAGVLLVWAALAASGWFSSFKLPAPWDVANAFATLAWSDGKSILLSAAGASMGRVLAAGLLVIAVGIPVGFLMGASTYVNAALSPLLDPFRSAPVVAFLPLFVMWLGIDETMKVAFLFCGAVVYLIPMTRDAVKAVPRSYWTAARDIGATPWECAYKTVLPLALPRIADAVITSFSIMWTYITVAEYVNAQDGLGQLIQNARRFSAMDQVIAGILTIVALAMLTYAGMTWLRAKAFKWETRT